MSKAQPVGRTWNREKHQYEGRYNPSGATVAAPAPTSPTYQPPNPQPGTPEYDQAYNGMIEGSIGYTPIQPGQQVPGMFQMQGQGVPNITQPGHAPGGMFSGLYGAPSPYGGMFGMFGGQ